VLGSHLADVPLLFGSGWLSVRSVVLVGGGGRGSESSFISIVPRFAKEHCLWKVSRLGPFVLLVRAMCI
jgi:hypothetical protein